MDGTLTIHPAPAKTPTTAQIPLPTPASNPASPGYSTAPGPTGATGTGVAVSLVRASDGLQSGLISVQVPKDMSTTGTGFSFALPAQIAQDPAAARTIRFSTAHGDGLPAWLRYMPETRSFVASAVPSSALPMQVEVTVGDQRFTVVITQRAD